MTLRTIPFGYQICRGKTTLQKDEAEIVRNIFSLYIDGKSLNYIAKQLNDAKVVYYQGKTDWNKSRISRILENEKYMGKETYPAIISEALFQKAKSLKDKKSCKQEKPSKEIELLKTLCVCGECGNRYKRTNTWASKEKWLCSKGCKCLEYVDDSALENAIVDAINRTITKPETLDVIVNSQFIRSKELLREENEFNRLCEQPKFDFKTIAKSILQISTIRFNCCEFDDGEITDALKNEISQLSRIHGLDYKIMKKYIKRVIIRIDGSITIVFINNATIKINGGTKNAD